MCRSPFVTVVFLDKFPGAKERLKQRHLSFQTRGKPRNNISGKKRKETRPGPKGKGGLLEAIPREKTRRTRVVALSLGGSDLVRGSGPTQNNNPADV